MLAVALGTFFSGMHMTRCLWKDNADSVNFLMLMHLVKAWWPCKTLS